MLGLVCCRMGAYCDLFALRLSVQLLWGVSVADVQQLIGDLMSIAADHTGGGANHA